MESREQKIRLKTHKFKTKTPNANANADTNTKMSSNEPYPSLYRMEEGTNIPVAHRIIDAWKADHRFRVTQMWHPHRDLTFRQTHVEVGEKYTMDIFKYKAHEET